MQKNQLNSFYAKTQLDSCKCEVCVEMGECTTTSTLGCANTHLFAPSTLQATENYISTWSFSMISSHNFKNYFVLLNNKLSNPNFREISLDLSQVRRLSLAAKRKFSLDCAFGVVGSSGAYTWHPEIFASTFSSAQRMTARLRAGENAETIIADSTNFDDVTAEEITRVQQAVSLDDQQRFRCDSQCSLGYWLWRSQSHR